MNCIDKTDAKSPRAILLELLANYTRFSVSLDAKLQQVKIHVALKALLGTKTERSQRR
jgi:hypothetical protein